MLGCISANWQSPKISGCYGTHIFYENVELNRDIQFFIPSLFNPLVPDFLQNMTYLKSPRQKIINNLVNLWLIGKWFVFVERKIFWNNYFKIRFLLQWLRLTSGEGERGTEIPDSRVWREIHQSSLWVLRYQLWNGSATLLLLRKDRRWRFGGSTVHSYTYSPVTSWE